MKQNNIQQIIENTIFNEVKKRIIQESEKEVMEVFHVTCEGQPLETFKTEKEAQQFVEKNKDKFNGKELIIDKKTYDSHEDMIDKLDEMGDMYEENENETMENKEPKEGNAFTEALLRAIEEGKDTFTVDGEEYDVKESWRELAEESLFEDNEGQCEECGDKDIKEGKGVCSECGNMLNKEGQCNECKGPMSMSEEKKCSECGGQLNEEGQCNECGSSMMKESYKKKLRLRESELVSLISKMVNEAMKGEPGVAGIPGITITKKAQDVSDKENKKNIGNVKSKIEDYLDIDGSDNPQFPKQMGKGDKMAIHNTDDENEYVEDTRGYALEDLDYDHEPSENFKKRLKDALEGDSKMGNSQDAANVVKTDTGKKLLNKSERKDKKEKKFPMYVKDPQPTQNVSESKVGFTTILTEEVEKMKRLTNYNKKTQ
jgi:hypothetical protein